jgi:hypothetical protein
VVTPQPGNCQLEGNMYYGYLTVDVGGTPPDMALALAPATQTVAPGGVVTITATATNQGPGMASLVTVSGFAALTRLGGLVVTPSQGTCATAAPGAPLTCALGSLVQGASATITFQGTAPPGLIPAGQTGVTLDERASVTFGNADSQPGNNSAQAQIVITGRADRPPSADAGADVVVEATGPAGAPVSLHGTGIDPDGGAVTFAWSGGCGVGAGASVTLQCPRGVSLVTLITTDPGALQGTDTVQVTVLDRVAPTITVTAPVNGATYTLNQVVTASYACADAVGVSTCQGTVPNGSPIDTSTVGAKTFTVTATDAAGNGRQEVRQYSVVAPTTACRGLPDRQMLPFAPDGSTSYRPKRLPAQLLAIFQACDGQGQAIGTPGFVTSFRLVRATVLASGRVVATDQPVATVPAGGFQYNPTFGYWQTAIDTRGMARRRRYEYRVTLNDGTSINFSFSIR